jgi:hypothetical protein
MEGLGLENFGIPISWPLFLMSLLAHFVTILYFGMYILSLLAASFTKVKSGNPGDGQQ